MIDLSDTYQAFSTSRIHPFLDELKRQNQVALTSSRWGDLPRWIDAVNQLPMITPSFIDLNADRVVIGRSSDCDQTTQKQIEQLLTQFLPWRKGPFDLFGIHVDSEWRSDLKWNRLKDHIQSLEGRTVLDVGCSNGYHCLRMKSAGAKYVLGVDPTLLYVFQFYVLQKYLRQFEVGVFPIGIDELSAQMQCFDTVFSMGLLYHRRSPFEHLIKLKSFLREDGELVLETIVIDGKEGDVLSPKDRYAKMANVWFIPSALTVESWLARLHFKKIRQIDISRTTSEEQRSTIWTAKHSLSDFLDPQNPQKTVEGYPAPQRAIFSAHR